MTRERELAGRAFRLTNPGFDGRTQLVQGTMDRLGESVQIGRRQRVESAKVRSHRKYGRFGDVLATLDHNSLLPFRGGSAPAPPLEARHVHEVFACQMLPRFAMIGAVILAVRLQPDSLLCPLGCVFSCCTVPTLLYACGNLGARGLWRVSLLPSRDLPCRVCA